MGSIVKENIGNGRLWAFPASAAAVFRTIIRKNKRNAVVRWWHGVTLLPGRLFCHRHRVVGF